MQQRRDRVQWVYAAKNNRELEERYDEWADEYDRDLREEFDWIAPRATVGLFGKYVAQDAKILDAGVGTGLVGECLIGAGYHDLHGIDLSMRMLDMARRKAMYRELRQMTLGEALDFADDTFDAVVSVGVFTTGHAPAHAFHELIRITRNGGHILFSLKTELHEEGFGQYLDDLETAGEWSLVGRSERYRPMPKGEPEVEHQVWVYRVGEYQMGDV
ncbi:MAG: class I SAM-dependent methyltransferase [Gammaproteobacteria bacterium]|nr:class I SAM-dependent methyltransferase [Gammaproteobacteria bacterium]